MATRSWFGWFKKNPPPPAPSASEAAKRTGLEDAKTPPHSAGGEAKGDGLGEVKVPAPSPGESAKGDGLGAAKDDGLGSKQSVPGESAKADGLGAAKGEGLDDSKLPPHAAAESAKADGLGAAKGEGLGSEQPVPGESAKGDGLGAVKDDGLDDAKAPPHSAGGEAKGDGLGEVKVPAPSPGESAKGDGLGAAQLAPSGGNETDEFSEADDVQFELKLSDVSIRNSPVGKEMAEFDGDELIDLPSEAAARGVYEPDQDVLGIDRIHLIDHTGKQAAITDHTDDGLDDFGLPTSELHADASLPNLAHADVGRGKGQEIEVENDETHLATGGKDGEVVSDAEFTAAVEVELPDLGGDDPGWREGADEFKVEIEGDLAGSLLTEDDANGLDG